MRDLLFLVTICPSNICKISFLLITKIDDFFPFFWSSTLSSWGIVLKQLIISWMSPFALEGRAVSHSLLN